MPPLISTGSMIVLNNIQAEQAMYLTNFINTAVPGIVYFVLMMFMFGLIRGIIEGLYEIVLDSIRSWSKW